MAWFDGNRRPYENQVGFEKTVEIENLNNIVKELGKDKRFHWFVLSPGWAMKIPTTQTIDKTSDGGGPPVVVHVCDQHKPSELGTLVMGKCEDCKVESPAIVDNYLKLGLHAYYAGRNGVVKQALSAQKSSE